MNRVFRFGFFLFFCVMMPIAATAQDARELINAGNAAYLLRSKNIDEAKTAIKKWNMAFQIDSGNCEPLYKASMAYCFLGRFASDSASAKKLFQKALESAKKAAGLYPQKVAAHFWWAFSLAKSVEKDTKFAQLKVRSIVLEHLNSAKQLDPKYYFGGPDRALGMIALTGPVPDVDLAKKHLQLSLEIEPEFSATLLLLAKVYIKEKQFLKGRSTLQKLIESEPKPGFEKEFNSDKKTAEQLMTSTENK